MQMKSHRFASATSHRKAFKEHLLLGLVRQDLSHALHSDVLPSDGVRQILLLIKIQLGECMSYASNGPF